MITREDLKHFSISIEDYGNGWYDSKLYYKGKLVATYPCSGHIHCVIDEENMKELEFNAWLEDAVPMNLLSEEQVKEAKRLDEGGSKVDSIKYINQVVNDGLKTAKTYYDLYIHNK